MSKHLHIISFNVPYPANYGGVIDVFHKIRWLHETGVKIHLHCFFYGRDKAKKLEQYCESVHYYPRRSWLSNISTLPYIINSRRHPALLQRLLQDDYPIIFEGLHTCFLLDNENLKNRVKIFRESNIEHEYYNSLMTNESSLWKKIYYKVESIRLRHFEKIISNSNVIATVSEQDAIYFKKSFPNNKVKNITSFHENDMITSQTGRGDFVLFHGNLSVAENIEAARFIVEKIAAKSKFRFVIAGLSPSAELKQLINKNNNVQLIESPNDEQMNDLMHQAHIHFLYTNQTTGLKLKLINALYKGRFLLVNSKMLHGVDANEECVVADSEQEFIQKIEDLMKVDFNKSHFEKRVEFLQTRFNNEQNIEKLISLIY